MYVKELNEVRGYIDDKQKSYLLSLTDQDLHRDKLVELLAVRKGIPPMFNPRDKVKIPLNRFHNLSALVPAEITTEEVDTTVGRFIFNLFMNDKYDNYFFRTCGYVNITINQGEMEKIDDKITKAFLNNNLTSEEYIDYIERRDWLGYSTCHYLTPSLDAEAIAPHPEVTKLRYDLYKKYAKELETNLVGTMGKIDAELIALAKTKLKDVPGFHIFLSGVKGSFNNNYKNTAIHRGVIKDEANNKYLASKSNLIEGIPKDEIHIYSNIMVTGAAAKALATQKGGYLNKMISSAFQNVKVVEGDCGSSTYMEITLTEDMVKKNYYAFRYIKEGNGLTLLTPKNIRDYIGKKILLRSAQYCKSKDFCSTCAGLLFTKNYLAVENVGVLFSRPAGIVLNASMKKFHDQSIKTKRIDINQFIEFIK